jgi:uncharacterized membrane protein YccC
LRFPSLTIGDALFSLKTFLAALIALYIAFLWNLSQPYWALLTVLIVAQPYTGMVRSKALYRFIGTFVGAAMAVFLIPRLVNLPELLTFFLAGWIALCLYLSLIDGTPRSYAYILSGYTVALIGFPSVEHPAGIFTTAVSRVEEVCLGILSTFVVNELFFPRSSVGLFYLKANQWLDHLKRSVVEILKKPPGTATLTTVRHKLSIDLAALAPLSLFASYDTSNSDRIRGMDLLLFRMGQILPVLSEIVRHLERIQGNDPERLLRLRPILEGTGEWIAGPSSSALPVALGVRREEESGATSREWTVQGLETRLREFCLLWKECRSATLNNSAQKISSPVRPLPHRDHLLAAMSSAAIFMTVLISANFWILTQWPDGAVATMMAAVVSSFFSTLDDPAPAIFRFLGFITAGSATGILFLYALLPMAHDFLSLSLLLALVLLPGGLFLGRPETAIPVLAFFIGFGGLIALSSTYSGNFTHSLNTALAQSAGVLLAAGITRLLRSVGADWSVRRLFLSDLQDLARIASSPSSSPSIEGSAGEDSPQMALSRILDRTAQLAIRLQALTVMERAIYSESFLHVGVARTLFHLSKLEGTLSDPLKSDLLRLRTSLGSYFLGIAARRWEGLPARIPEPFTLSLPAGRDPAVQDLRRLLFDLETLLSFREGTLLPEGAIGGVRQ